MVATVILSSDELIVLSASGTAACVDLQLATAEFLGAPQGILCMYMFSAVSQISIFKS